LWVIGSGIYEVTLKQETKGQPVVFRVASYNIMWEGRKEGRKEGRMEEVSYY
jgi:hypothetical protein